MTDAGIAEAYARDGYAIVRGLFAVDEVAALGEAIDRVHAEGVAHGRSFRHGNLFYDIAPAKSDGAPLVRMAQWPAYGHPALDAARTDPRFVRLLAPMIGEDLKQIIHQIHWKAPGGKGDFAWHQDSRFRKPAEAYRNLGASYIQTGLAIDPHTRESGCMRFLPRSHRRGDLAIDEGDQVLGRSMADAALEAAGLDPAGAVDVVLAPGDLALWSPYLVHGSGNNASTHQRRLLINGYVRAEDCDRGEWAFRDGEPVPLGPEPAMVHYEQLRERGEPHYV